MTKKDAYEQLTKDNMPERSETSFFGRFLGKLFPLILLGASFDLFYRLFLFQNLPQLGILSSVIAYVSFHALFTVLYALLLTALDDDSVTATAVSISFPGVLYTFLTRPEMQPRSLLILAVISGIFAVVFLLILFSKKKKVGKKVLKALGAYVKLAGVVLFLAVIGPVFASMMFSTGTAFSKRVTDPVELTENRFSDTAIIEANKDSLSELTDFDEMSVAEKLDTLQLLANIEAEYLGIERPIVVPYNLKENTWGEYTGRESNIIRIDAERLVTEEGKELFHTLFHECYHGYIEALIEKYPEEKSGALLFEREMEAYRFEEENYVSPEQAEEFSLYAEQLCEIRCNEYAKKRLSDYQSVIRF